MYNFLIYDFDGTLSDTYPVFTDALLTMLERHNIKGDYATAYKQLKQSVGFALRQYDFGVTPEEASREYHQIHRALAIERQEAFPESAQILSYAKAHGAKNYVYTHTGKLVYELLEKMGLDGYIEFVLDGTYDFPRKPAPDALNFLCEKCGIDKMRALMIGDRDIDIDAAHAANIAGCLIDPEGFFPECKAEYRINALTELQKII